MKEKEIPAAQPAEQAKMNKQREEREVMDKASSQEATIRLTSERLRTRCEIEQKDDDCGDSPDTISKEEPDHDEKRNLDDDAFEENQEKDFCAPGAPTVEELTRYLKTKQKEADEISNQVTGKEL